ncbi:Ig-like domain-containing protein [Pseudomonas chlororaphis]|uniref:Ig-like domain-containing protein n=1 Tax=Pseudomonas chlororaphis TaxID=587753 RepID=UPI000F584B6C|nr:Ig-like domain-containing protein [Pseudomonas chlororaphis]AZC59381.1 EF hand domain/PKD domain protein [Pseudomonas chlororaphis subsp. piscium]
MSSISVNVAVVDGVTITQSVMLRATKKGTPVKIKAIADGKYILTEGEKGAAPENITLKRVGNDLYICLEDTELDQPQMIIEEFFLHPGVLLGLAEDGAYYQYVASDADSDHEAAFLVDGDSSAHVLGIEPVTFPSGLVAASGVFWPGLIGLGVLGALGGMWAASGNSGGHSGGGSNDKVILTPSLDAVIDDVGNIQGPIVKGGVTDDANPILSGTGQPGNTIEIWDNKQKIGEAQVDGNGNWTFSPEVPLVDGQHSVVIVEKDAQGNTSSPSESFDFIVDTSAPNAAEQELTDDVGPITGAIVDGTVTDDNTPTLDGTAEPGSTVIVSDNGVEIGEVEVGEDGTWSFTPETPLEDGEHSISTVVVDEAGNRSPESDPIDFVVDTTPAVPVDPAEDGTDTPAPVNPDEGGSDTPAPVNPDEGGSDIPAPVNPDEGGSDIPAPVNPDEGGSDVPAPVNPDEGGSDVPAPVNPDEGGSDVPAPVNPDEGGSDIPAPVNPDEGGSDVPAPVNPDEGGSDVPAPVSPDEGGSDVPAPVNPDEGGSDVLAPNAAEQELTDDVGPITGAIVDGTVTDDNTPTLDGTAEPGSTVIISDNGVEIGEAEVGEDGSWSFTPETPLEDGEHSISTVVVDEAGNRSPESDPIDFVVDTVAPGAAEQELTDDVGPITGAIVDGTVTDDNTPTLDGTAEPGSTVIISDNGVEIGEAEVGEDGSWSFTPETPLEDGEHSISTVVVDEAGNRSPESDPIDFVVDTVAPGAAEQELTDDVGPITGAIVDGTVTDDNTPTLDGTAEPGSTVIISDNGVEIGEAEVGEDGSWSFTPETPLEDGEHSISTVVVDEAGNRSPESDPIDFVVDTTPAVPVDPAEDGTDTPAPVNPDEGGSDIPAPVNPAEDGTDTPAPVNPDEGGSDTPAPVNPDEGGSDIPAPVNPDEGGSDIPAPVNPDEGGSDVPAPVNPDEGGSDVPAPVNPDEGGSDVPAPVNPDEGGSDIPAPVNPDEGGSDVPAPVNPDEGGSDVPAPVSPDEGGSDVPAPVNPDEGGSDVLAPNAAEQELTDDVGPITGAIVDGTVTDDNTPTLDGTAEPGSTVIISDNGVEIGEAEVGEDGSWSFTPETPLEDGEHSISTVVVDEAGNRSPESDPIDFVVDTVAPGAAEQELTDDVGPITGAIVDGTVTDDNTPTLDGTAEPGSTVIISDNGVEIGEAEVGEDGSWSFTPETPLEDGEHSISTVVVDEAGNRSPESDPIDFVVDTTPAVPVDPAEDGTDTPAPVNPDEGGSDIPAPVNPDEGGSDIPAPVNPDEGGSDIPAPVNPDEGGSDIPAPVNPDEGGSDIPAPVNPDEGGSDIPAPVNPDEGGSDVPAPVNPDEGGSDVPAPVNPDEGGSDIPAPVNPDEGGSDVPAPVNPDEGGSDVPAPVSPDEGGSDVPAPVNPDEGGSDVLAPNAAEQELTDDVGPITGAIVDGTVTDDNTPTLDGTAEPGSTVIISDNGVEIGEAEVGEDGSWSFTPETPLEDGEHSISTVVVDEAGNRSPESDPIDFVVDTVAPGAAEQELTDDVGPITGAIVDGTVTDDNTPTLDGTAEPGSTVIISDNGVEIGEAEVGEDGSWSFTPETPLEDGEHSISTVVVDEAGNRSPESDPIDFVVDTVAPGAAEQELTDDVGPITGAIVDGTVTDDNTPTLDGTAEPGSTVIISDNGVEIGEAEVGEDGSWSFTPETPLEDGEHSISTVVVDEAGNRSPESDPIDFVVDTVAPGAAEQELTDDVGPITGAIVDGTVTDDNTPTLDGTAEPGSTVIVSDNGVEIGEVEVGEDGTWSFTPETPLEDGEHSISTVVVDEAGNRSPESDPIDFVVDTSNVDVVITHAVDDVGSVTGNLSSGSVTDDTTPTLQGTATANSQVRIYDAAGTLIGEVTASADGSWSFEVPELSEGSHSFTAIATNAAGTESASTAAFVLEIDTTAPDAADQELTDDVGSITGAIVDGTVTDDNTPTLDGTAEPGSTVIVSDNGVEIGEAEVGEDGSWSFTPETPLEDGEHSISTVVVDEAGNRSPESDPIDFVVDTSSVEVAITHAVDDVGSVTGNLSSGSVTDDTTPTLQGTATANSQVRIYDAAGTLIGEVTASADGSWSFEVPELSEGSHSFTAVATNAAGNASAPSTPWVVTIDTSIQTQVVISSMSKDSGSDVNDFITNDGTAGRLIQGKLTATLKAGEKVQVSTDDGVTWQDAVVTDDGVWSVVDQSAHSSSWAIQARVVGNAGEANTARQSVTLDTSVNAPTSVSWDGSTIEITFDGSGLVIGDTLNVIVDGLIVEYGLSKADIATGTVTIPWASSAENIKAALVDSVGNVSSYREKSISGVVFVEDFNGQQAQVLEVGASYALSNITVTYTAQGPKGPNGVFNTAFGTGQTGVTTLPTSMALEIGKDVSLTIDINSKSPVNHISFVVGDMSRDEVLTITFYDQNGVAASTQVLTKEDGKLTQVIAELPEGSSFSSITFYNGADADRWTIAWIDDMVFSNTGEVIGGLVEPDTNQVVSQSDVVYYGGDADNVFSLADVGMLSSNVGGISGGTGMDTLTLTGANQILDLTALGNKLVSIEVIDLTGSGNNTLNLSLDDVLSHGESNLFHGSDTVQMMVNGNAGDVVNLDGLVSAADSGEWLAQGALKLGLTTYQIYQHSTLAAELLVQQGLQTNLI